MAKNIDKRYAKLHNSIAYLGRLRATHIIIQDGMNNQSDISNEVDVSVRSIRRYVITLGGLGAKISKRGQKYIYDEPFDFDTAVMERIIKGGL